MTTITLYKTTNVKIRSKIPHIRKPGGKVYGGFCNDEGDVPVAVIGDDGLTQVVNNRPGYALRNAKKFRNKKIYSRKND